jgi:tetratricopeptide (TPR) repeat protein
LTLTKRQNQLAEAVAELDLGHAAVAHQSGEEDSIRRERGWWHNLRGLTLFRQGDLGAALNHEKSALECIEGLTDASSIHLRINLVSNISVLQESAGKAHQALQTWNRFENSGFGDQITFVKHHAYRSGGLRVKTGDLAAGLTDLRRSLRYCVELADDFHECEIATEIGGLLLDRGESEPAAESYAQASAAATRLGDPYRMALSQAGIAAAQGRTLDARIGAVAAGSRTVTERAQILAEACRQGSDPDALLPRPRTKLNRPFDLINL